MLIKTNDINLIKTLDDACFNNQAYSLNVLNQMLNNNEFYFINENNTNVGFIILQKIDLDYELIKIGILNNYRKQGWAFKALKEIIDNYDYRQIILEVSNKNNNAIKLYEKLGFKHISTRKKYYQDQSDAFIMIYFHQ